MTSRHSLSQRVAVALALAAILLLGFAVAYAQNAEGKGKADGKQPAAKPEAKKGDAAKARIKVFRLTHVDLETITGVLNSLLPESVDEAPPALALGGGGLGGGGIGLMGGGPNAGGALGLGGGLGGLGAGGGGALGLGGGLGGLQGAGGGMFGGLGGGVAAPAMSWRITEDPRTKSLIVRGPEKVLDLAKDVVTVLDLAADKPVPAVKSLRAYKLKHAKAADLNTVLTNLELDARLAAAKENILIVAGSEEIMKEIDGVVEALDIDVP
jgi:hypothetical protein